jgi:WD40 repeat protein
LHAAYRFSRNNNQVACDFNLGNKVYSHHMSSLASSHSLVAGVESKWFFVDEFELSLYFFRQRSYIFFSFYFFPLLLAGCEEARIRMCDLRTASSVITLSGSNALIFRIYFFFRLAHKEIRFHLVPGHEGSVTAVRWSPKDQYLLASGR